MVPDEWQSEVINQDEPSHDIVFSKGLLGGCFEHSSATQHPANSKQARKSPFRAHPGDISKNRAWKTAEMVQWVFSEAF